MKHEQAETRTLVRATPASETHPSSQARHGDEAGKARQDERRCPFCGDPMPEHPGRGRRYHEDCAEKKRLVETHLAVFVGRLLPEKDSKGQKLAVFKRERHGIPGPRSTRPDAAREREALARIDAHVGAYGPTDEARATTAAMEARLAPYADQDDETERLWIEVQALQYELGGRDPAELCRWGRNVLAYYASNFRREGCEERDRSAFIRSLIDAANGARMMLRPDKALRLVEFALYLLRSKRWRDTPENEQLRHALFLLKHIVIALEMGQPDADEAVRARQELETRARAVNLPSWWLQTLTQQGAVAIRFGRPPEAEELMGRADALFASIVSTEFGRLGFLNRYRETFLLQGRELPPKLLAEWERLTRAVPSAYHLKELESLPADALIVPHFRYPGERRPLSSCGELGPSYGSTVVCQLRLLDHNGCIPRQAEPA